MEEEEEEEEGEGWAEVEAGEGVLLTRELPAQAVLSRRPPCDTITPAEGQLSCNSFSSRKEDTLDST